MTHCQAGSQFAAKQFCEEGRETAKTTAVPAAAKRAALELLWDGQFVRAVPPVNTCGTGRLGAERRQLIYNV